MPAWNGVFSWPLDKELEHASTKTDDPALHDRFRAIVVAALDVIEAEQVSESAMNVWTATLRDPALPKWVWEAAAKRMVQFARIEPSARHRLEVELSHPLSARRLLDSPVPLPPADRAGAIEVAMSAPDPDASDHVRLELEQARRVASGRSKDAIRAEIAAWRPGEEDDWRPLDLLFFELLHETQDPEDYTVAEEVLARFPGHDGYGVLTSLREWLAERHDPDP